MLIRPATDTDLPAICAFWNPQIRDTIVTVSTEEKTVEGLRAMIAERRAKGHEFFVAEEAGRLFGLATYAQFRAGDGYRHCMEHTIILAPEAWGRGLGRALMARVEDHARAAGAHVMVACITEENAAGTAFHRALGYVETGRMPELAHKFGRWLGVLMLQKTL